MEKFHAELTAQELEDIRMSVMNKWFELDDRASEDSLRLSALMEKLARISVFGHA